MRDLKLKGEPFIFVRSIAGDDRITDLLRNELLAMGVTVTEYEGTLTIVCSSIVGIGSLADIATCVATWIDDEGPDIQFCGALGRALVARIG